MGSGLILLVIVAAWLAVLVPMALRSHESSTSLSSVDRFSDAMRVLSRRDAAARARARREADDDPLSAAAWADNEDDDAWDEDWDDELPHVGWRERLDGWRGRARQLLPTAGAAGPRGPSSPVVRRRRLLLALVALLVASSVAGLVGPRVLLGVAGALAVAVGLFVVQLRRLAVARARRPARPAPARRAAQPAPAPRPRPRPVEPVRSGSVRVQPIDVHPMLEPDADPVVATAAVRHDEPLPAAAPEVEEPAAWTPPAAALGGAWSPVPIPPPTYVTAAVAPRPAPRIVDLTRPGAWSQQESARAQEELPGSAPAAPPVADRRRAVNDW